METLVINQKKGRDWQLYHGDSCEVIKAIPSNSIHFQISSPPFSALFCYSNSERDMGNSRDDGQFFEHYRFLVREQLRVCMAGRLCAIHVMQLPSSKQHHGIIGLRDFRGECIRLFVEEGWIYHSEVCIWKNPAVAMMRTKALGLLHKQLKKDSAMCRQGVADYLLVFRKEGKNPEPVTKTNDSFPVPVWQRYASPVWATFDTLDEEGFAHFVDPTKGEVSRDGQGGIDQGDTLQAESAREEKDEKHLCCLQKGVIQRSIRLWSNPRDVVASWFAGIGSEGHVALSMGRKFIGCELKTSYFNQAALNLQSAESFQEMELPFGKAA